MEVKNTMYVVRRPFKNYGEVLVPGTVVQPDNIKMFKSRLRDHVIIEVPEHDLGKWNAYFKAKFGTTIGVVKKIVDAKAPTETKVAQATTQTKPKATTKPAVKVTAEPK